MTTTTHDPIAPFIDTAFRLATEGRHREALDHLAEAEAHMAIAADNARQALRAARAVCTELASGDF